MTNRAFNLDAFTYTITLPGETYGLSGTRVAKTGRIMFTKPGTGTGCPYTAETILDIDEGTGLLLHAGMGWTLRGWEVAEVKAVYTRVLEEGC